MINEKLRQGMSPEFIQRNIKLMVKNMNISEVIIMDESNIIEETIKRINKLESTSFIDNKELLDLVCDENEFEDDPEVYQSMRDKIYYYTLGLQH